MKSDNNELAVIESTVTELTTKSTIVTKQESYKLINFQLLPQIKRSFPFNTL